LTTRIVSNQVRYDLVDRTPEDGLLQHCDAHQISLLAFSPLATGVDHMRKKRPSICAWSGCGDRRENARAGRVESVRLASFGDYNIQSRQGRARARKLRHFRLAVVR
jgi:aryl-alcohol dehydrogenase-like predicted oxidoreductase